MTNKGWLVLILPLMIACASEFKPNSDPQSSKPHVIKITPNQKYKLEAIFSGTDVEVGDRKVAVIEQLTIRSSETGQQIQYKRSDGPSSSDAHAYFTDVWSPDNEFLVLPLARFRGFCIERAAEALAAIQKQSCFDMVPVRFESAALWHQFDQTRLKYDILSEWRVSHRKKNAEAEKAARLMMSLMPEASGQTDHLLLTSTKPAQ
jgi:hypothetical protein